MLASQSSICKCVYSGNIYKSVNNLSIIVEFVLSIVIVVCGILLNYRFKKNLDEEKRARPLGRKGNVIEPIMRWYQVLVMVFWTYVMLFFWLMTNEIIPAEWFSNCWFMNILMNPMRFGRSIIAYNSFFIALIRYLYIVHRKKSENWKFEKVGRIFQVTSIMWPLLMEVVRLFSEEDLNGLRKSDKFKSCVAFNEGWSNTTDIELPKPAAMALTLKVLPIEAVDAIYYIFIGLSALIFSNIIEGYMYINIFQTIKRDNDESFARGVLSNSNYKLDKKRSLVSLRMCIIGWLVEILGTLCHVLFLWLNNMGLAGMHYVECVIMFIIIPLVYLMNDDDTKGVIIDEGWVQGLRYLAGLRNNKTKNSSASRND